MFAVCVRVRAAVDANVDQHGSSQMHRRASVPVAADSQTGSHSYSGHVVPGVRTLLARCLLVPRNARSRCLYSRLPEIRRSERVRLFHRTRIVFLVSVTHGFTGIPLSKDFQ